MDNGSVIITGGSGFVGKHLLAELQSHPLFSRIVVFDRAVHEIPDGVESHVVDITNVETYVSIIKEVKPSWVIHLAAVSSVGFSLTHEDVTRTVNVIATETLIAKALEVNPDTKFLIISSADIYGKVPDTPLAELSLAEAHPTNPYGKSKLEMERIIEEKYNDHCIRVRPFPHIGPGQNTGFVTADFASQIAAIEKGKQPSEMVVGNLDAKRDFTDVRDVVRAYRLLIKQGTLGQVYHVASSKAHSIQSVLDTLLSMSTVEIQVSRDTSRVRPSDNPVMIGSIEKIKKVTGWEPTIPFETSLTDILNDWRSRV